jgi:hypothetical protein
MLSSIRAWRVRRRERAAAKLAALGKSDREAVEQLREDRDTRTTMGYYGTFAKHAGEDFGPKR